MSESDEKRLWKEALERISLEEEFTNIFFSSPFPRLHFYDEKIACEDEKRLLSKN